MTTRLNRREFLATGAAALAAATTRIEGSRRRRDGR